MAGQHAPGYQRAYKAQERAVLAWVRSQLPNVWAWARGEDVDPSELARQLETLADSVDEAAADGDHLGFMLPDRPNKEAAK